MGIKERIKELCDTQGITLKDLEIELGFGKGYISKIDNQKPNSAYIGKIAKRLNTTTDYILEGRKDVVVENAIFEAHLADNSELYEAIKKAYSLNSRKQAHIIELINLLSEE